MRRSWMWVAAAMLAAVMLPVARLQPHSKAQQGAVASPCLGQGHATSSPSTLLLGETVVVTLTATTLCASDEAAFHVVLVLDASGSMEGAPIIELRKAGRQLIQALDMRNNPATRVGVVSFAGSANILCQLTNDASRASGCVGQVGASGGSSISSGILAGIRVLVAGRRDLALDADSVREVLVVMTNGEDNAGCGPVRRAAGQASGGGILLMSVGLGPEYDRKCLYSIASQPEFFYDVHEGPNQLPAVFTTIATVLRQVRAQFRAIATRSHAIAVHLPPDMVYVPDIVRPAPSILNPAANVLTWTFGVTPSDGITVFLRVRPLEGGRHAVMVAATGAFTDTRGRTGAIAFDVPGVNVLAPPDPLPLPTEPATETSTATPAPTVTPTAYSTAVPRPVPKFLPLVLADWSP